MMYEEHVPFWENILLSLVLVLSHKDTFINCSCYYGQNSGLVGVQVYLIKSR
jgi:hypothetical protein